MVRAPIQRMNALGATDQRAGTNVPLTLGPTGALSLVQSRNLET